jgi:hypothetical protein
MARYVVRLVVEVDDGDIGAIYAGTLDYMVEELGLTREAFESLRTDGKVDPRACLQLLFENDVPFGTEITSCEVEKEE